jgi:hypothetical protein
MQDGNLCDCLAEVTDLSQCQHWLETKMTDTMNAIYARRLLKRITLIYTDIWRRYRARS